MIERDDVGGGLSEERQAELRERVRRSVNNISELRELLLELLDSDQDLAEMLRGPPVSSYTNDTNIEI